MLGCIVLPGIMCRMSDILHSDLCFILCNLNESASYHANGVVLSFLFSCQISILNRKMAISDEMQPDRWPVYEPIILCIV